ncbi:MAG: preprotein translocase subunit SecA, partial [Pseudomonadota bacterium]|nr:preprotein translocase subunit SecA [Pseudomonadota bacterium]
NSVKSLVDQINNLEESISKLTDSELGQQTVILRDRLAKGETLDAILPVAYATVREASKRVLGERHYDVQIIGGIALHRGNIAEMRTGEGKTLVATLPTYLHALTGRGVHVVTANDYLARRDGAWMGPIFSLLGITLSVVNSQNVSYIFDATVTKTDSEDLASSYKVDYDNLRTISRKEAYAADITYGTNNEYGFDYLRDNLATSMDNVVQRGHVYALVDEIDSILIDEARTPLIISSESKESGDLYGTCANIAKNLIPETDYTMDEKHKSIALTDSGINKIERALNIDNIYTEKGIRFVHHIENAVRAKALYLIDRDYVVKDNEVIIVDTFTGRMQPGRRWSDGLHQAIEAKEHVLVQKETKTVASITFQNYFRFYERVAGMTGTAETSAEEFRKVYNLGVIVIPTHRPINRKDHPDLIYQTEISKFRAIAKRVKEIHKTGQPVLIGTVSIDKNEILSAYLKAEGVPHTALNAKNHEREGELIAEAGKRGAVTVATNMAGRGVDIKLGGVPFNLEAHNEIKELGGLFVIGSERHEARRIDNQLRGRAGRQGDPGQTQFFASLEDDLMRVFGGDKLKSIMVSFKFPEDMPIENVMVSRTLENAQSRIEGFHFDSRKHTLEFDDVLNFQRKSVYSRRRAILDGSHDQIEQELEMLTGDSTLESMNEIKTIIETKKSLVGEQNFYETLRRIMLYSMDIHWQEHLELMDYARSSTSLRAYGQREPLVEYKKEGLRLYREFEFVTQSNILELIKTIDIAK